VGDYGGGAGRPPFGRTLIADWPRKELDPGAFKINTQARHTMDRDLDTHSVSVLNFKKKLRVSSIWLEKY
jgi:hypothetical protein